MITVVIPLYNKEKNISETLESVLNQKIPPEDIIVVDDGSTDNGVSVVNGYLKRGVKLIQQENQGVSAARNTGVVAAMTKYVAFLDADDLWLPDHLKLIGELVEKYPDAALYSTSHFIKRNGELLRPKSNFHLGWSGVVFDFFSVYAKGLSLVNTSCACVRRDVFLEMGGFPRGISRGEDVIVWINLALNNAVAHLEIQTSIYNQEADNRSENVLLKTPPGSLIHLGELINSVENKSKLSGLKKLFNKIAFYTAAGLKSNGDTDGVNIIKKTSIKYGSFFAIFSIFCIELIPSYVFKWLRSRRHRKIKSH